MDLDVWWWAGVRGAISTIWLMAGMSPIIPSIVPRDKTTRRRIVSGASALMCTKMRLRSEGLSTSGRGHQRGATTGFPPHPFHLHVSLCLLKTGPLGLNGSKCLGPPAPV